MSTTRVYSFTFNTYESGDFTAMRYPAGVAVCSDWACIADSDAEAERLAHHAAENEWTAPESRDPHGFTIEFVDSSPLADVPCQCGQWSGEPCQWSGSKNETVVVEFMPEHLRASHEAAGNSGSYPGNGAVRVRVEASCAALMAKTDGQWCAVVGQ